MDYTKLLPKRAQDSHKGTFGKVLNIAGSTNYQGAAYLSSVSALKIGAGYVTLATPDYMVDNFASLGPDITFLPLGSSVLEKLYLIEDNLPKYDVVSIGCGLGCDYRTVFFVNKVLDLLENTDIPVVIDADAINALAISNRTNLPENSIITPHEGELARLLKIKPDEVSSIREGFAKEISKKLSCTTVLKGHNSVVCSVDLNIVINQTGNSSLAKAGTGDVLTGMISGLLAQGLNTYDAALLGVYLHGLTGEVASENLSEYSVLASDLLKFIPLVVKNLNKLATFPIDNVLD
ncbi:MAG: NAD(P)H-hydrate dehydratase [Candidatus Gastranaerophilales bacterium]|nr:NAD(P)H-hydrate dehydratase [Candidatus Gastranaerophilales bacterium]